MYRHIADSYRILPLKALDDRYDQFQHSPLELLDDKESLFLALCEEFSWTPELLSDEETEDRFIDIDKVCDERSVYAMESISHPAKYNKKAIWESKEAWWMTYRVGLVST